MHDLVEVALASSPGRERPRLFLFGAPALHVAGAPVPFVAERRYQLLVLLAIHRGEWVQRDLVASLLWPDRPAMEARRNLRKVVFRARELPGTESLEAGEQALRWHVDTDLAAYREALSERRLAEAIAIGGPPLCTGIDAVGNEPLAEWLARQREQAASSWRQACIELLATSTDQPQRLALARRLLESDALDESAIEVLIRDELAGGRGAGAQRIYNDYAVRLAESLGIEPSSSLRRCLEPQGPAAARETAPDESDRLIGRRTEMTELRAMLAEPQGRLVTLVGPGGVGKSRLARQALAEMGASFPGGARWTDLQDLIDVSAVVARLAGQLGLELRAGEDPLEQVSRRLPPTRNLLVLDNGEHLDGLPLFLDRLLAAAPGACVLLTSRTLTRCRDEWPMRLHGLAVPDALSRDFDVAPSFDAVRLFDTRARAALRGFDLRRHLAAVIDIVEAVDGLPLAIELAAAWVRLLPPEEIASDLGRSIDALERDPTSTVVAARPEHASLRAVLDRSFSLLADAERRALAALSIFEGGFTHRAARSACEVALPLLSSLVDRSLVGGGADGRFTLHPTIAAYAAARLADEPSRAHDVHRRHTEYFARELAELAPHAIGDQRLLVRGVIGELANHITAWRRALAMGRIDLVGDMVRALWSFFENQGRLPEGIRELRPALAIASGSTSANRAISRSRHGLSMLLHRSGELSEALDVAQAGIALAEKGDDSEAWVGCILNTGMAHYTLGDNALALERFEEGLRVATACEDRHSVGWALGNRGVALQVLGRLEESRADLTLALEIMRELGDQYNVAINLTNLGNLQNACREFDAARLTLGDGLRHCAAFGIDSIGRYIELNMGRVCRNLGLLAQAREHFSSSQAWSRESGAWPMESSSSIGLARIDIAEGEHEAALARLRDVVRAAAERRSPQDVLYGASAYAEWLVARNEPLAAARLLRMVAQDPGLDVPTRRDAAERAERLTSGTPHAGAVDACTIDEFLLALNDPATSR